jgi:hypothetical protein
VAFQVELQRPFGDHLTVIFHSHTPQYSPYPFHLYSPPPAPVTLDAKRIARVSRAASLGHELEDIWIASAEGGDLARIHGDAPEVRTQQGRYRIERGRHHDALEDPHHSRSLRMNILASIGHTAAPPISVMNSRRLIASPEAHDKAS